jgi:hypothetical protein
MQKEGLALVSFESFVLIQRRYCDVKIAAGLSVNRSRAGCHAQPERLSSD